MSDFETTTVIGTSAFLRANKVPAGIECIEASENELASLSEFQSNDSALAIARLKENTPITIKQQEFALVLDDIRDPGNLGTIIRTADWFGINKIIASPETADFYNPKVISATMGSFTRVSLFYTELDQYLSNSRLPSWGAFLGGRDVHQVDFKTGGYIVIGNESRGISPLLEEKITQKITIPRYGQAESLNAAIATAIICDVVINSKFKV